MNFPISVYKLYIGNQKVLASFFMKSRYHLPFLHKEQNFLRHAVLILFDASRLLKKLCSAASLGFFINPNYRLPFVAFNARSANTFLFRKNH